MHGPHRFWSLNVLHIIRINTIHNKIIRARNYDTQNHLRYDSCIECTLVHYNHTEGPGAPRTSWNIYLKAININNQLVAQISSYG